MKKRLWTGIAALIICLLSVVFEGSTDMVHANDSGKTYSFSMAATVSGTVGETLSGQVYTISFNNGTKLVSPLPAGKDISHWFMGENSPLPAGMKVKVQENAAIGAASIKVEFSGKIYGASCDNIKMQVQNYFFDETEPDYYSYAAVTFKDTAPKYNTVRNVPIPSGYSAANQGIYFKDQVSGTAGWKLTGAKGTAVSSNNELQVFIDGNFLVNIAANTNISSWFTGETVKFMDLFSTVTGSFLPEGVTARIKNAVNVGDNTFAIVFTGTPTKGSKDLIAFAIPAGYTSWNKGIYAGGDSQNALKVTNTTGKYAYNITTNDPSDYYTEYVMITLPDVELEAGIPVTESDNVIVQYDIVGENLTFKGIEVGKTDIQAGLSYQTPGKDQYNDVITTRTGLKGTVIEISQDKKTIKARLTGTPKSGSVYPYSVGGSGFILHPSKNSKNTMLNGIFVEDHYLTITEPVFRGSVMSDVTVTKGIEDTKATVTGNPFVISLGSDTLAMDLAKGTYLELFYPETQSRYYLNNDMNGIYIVLDQAAKAGDSELHARVSVFNSEMRVDQKGYLRLAFPKKYLSRMAQMGSRDYYDLPGSRIYVNVELLKEENRLYWPGDQTIKGTYSKNYVKEMKEVTTTTYDPELGEQTVTEQVEVITGLDIKPLGTGKVYFTLTIYKEGMANIEKSYSAGDSVLDFIDFSFLYDKNEDKPFYLGSYDKKLAGDGFKFYDIHTAEDIEAGEGTIPRILNLYVDLAELYPVRSYHEPIIFSITTLQSNGKRITRYSDTNPDFCFDIYEEGYGPADGGEAPFEAGIVYNKQDVILYAKDDSGAEVKTTYINLSKETFTAGIEMKAYSLDGGTKWKAATSITDKQLASMLNKGMTLVIADKFDSKKKQPSEDAELLSFIKINARPKSQKYKVDYAEYSDKTCATPGEWALTNGTELYGKESLAALDIGIADSTKKKVDARGYGSWPEGRGLNVAPFPAGEKPKQASTIYFIRTAPEAGSALTGATPASKAVKLTVKGQQKAPSIKVDYKKEIIKVKTGMTVFFGGNVTGQLSALSENANSFDDYYGKAVSVTTAEEAKAGIDLAPYITTRRNTILVWTDATSKKPGTAAQVIKLAARSEADTDDEAIYTLNSKGKLSLGKNYEVWDVEKGKWGGLPKISDNTLLKIRKKATVKSGKENDTTFAAGETMYLEITRDAENNCVGSVKVTE